jgi:CubicO group peptidase (beta-lactamase class C family)
VATFPVRVFFGAVLFLAASCLGAGPTENSGGTWEGEMGMGTHTFRVAFVLKEGLGEYHNIDDGIHGEPMTLEWNGEKLRAQTTGGGTIELFPSQGGKLMTGVFRQGEGTDSQQSLVGENQNYPVTLHRGEDYLHPRLGPDGRERIDYEYAPPGKMPDGWEIGDLRLSRADPAKIQNAVQNILKSNFPYIHSLLLVKDGKLVLDEYFYGYGPGDPHPVMSVTKDVFSILFGIAENQGLCRPDQKLFDFFQDYHSRPGWDAAKDAITLESLLTMTSGLGCDDFKDSSSCSWKMFPSPDWLDFSLSLPLENLPGSRFAYCGACLSPLAAILEKQSGLKVNTFAQKYLFDPLGIQAPLWWEGPRDFHSPAFGLALKPRDMAKIGLLVLRKGEWSARQVVPKKWIGGSTAPHVPASLTGKKADYGYLWWERDARWHGKKLRVLDAWGVGGQHIFIVPDLDLVCVVTGGNYKDGILADNSFKIFHEVLEAFR